MISVTVIALGKLKESYMRDFAQSTKNGSRRFAK